MLKNTVLTSHASEGKDQHLFGVGHHLRHTMNVIQRRYQLTNNEKKYVNVAGGSSGDTRMEEIRHKLADAGFLVHRVPGPLLLTTQGGNHARPELMPFTISSAHGPTSEILTSACGPMWGLGAQHDPDLDVEPGAHPKWSTHSLRRCAATMARKFMDSADVTEADIDLYMGWHEKVLLKNMQRHYEQMDLRRRIRQARITGYM